MQTEQEQEDRRQAPNSIFDFTFNQVDVLDMSISSLPTQTPAKRAWTPRLSVAARSLTVGMYLDCADRAEALCVQAYWRNRGGDTRRMTGPDFVRVWRLA